MGAEHDFTVELISLNSTERIANKHITGDLSAFGIVAQKAVKPEAVQPEDKDAERLLYEEAITYIDRRNQSEDELLDPGAIVAALGSLIVKPPSGTPSAPCPP